MEFWNCTAFEFGTFCVKIHLLVLDKSSHKIRKTEMLHQKAAL